MLVLLSVLQLDPHLAADVIIGRVDGQLDFLPVGCSYFVVLLVRLLVEDDLHVYGALEPAQK